jgi:hypothetical protein
VLIGSNLSLPEAILRAASSHPAKALPYNHAQKVFLCIFIRRAAGSDRSAFQPALNLCSVKKSGQKTVEIEIRMSINIKRFVKRGAIFS